MLATSRKRFELELFGLPTTITVSYTHLDVYKRQNMRFGGAVMLDEEVKGWVASAVGAP